MSETQNEFSDLSGQIERVTFTSEESGYTIAKVKVYGRRELVTVVGNILCPTPGEIIKMKGEWSNHPKFGEQFKLAYYKTTVPASVHGIEKYLGSGLIKGIGPVMAKRIVKLFGEATLDVIEADIQKLIEVPGIGSKRVGMIAQAWEEQKEIRSVMLFLQTHGVSSGYATKIYKQYKNESIAVVQENPYRLAHDIFGIGFVTADKIAQKLGFDKNSPLRAEAGILYVLHQLSDEGHVFYPQDPLIVKAIEILEVEPGVLVDALGRLATEHKIVAETLDRPDGPVEAIYLAKYHLSENQVAARLKALQAAAKGVRSIDAEKAVEWVQEKLSMTLAEKQVEAVKAAATSKVLVITGGPGTGKTTIIRAILKIFSAITKYILLAAPTGRAAKRMSEATGHEAKTLHRLLEYSMQKGGFQKNEDHPLDCELIVVDEASMIDLILMHHLLKAIPKPATLILVGDVDQLPSVGAGNVLKDVIASGAVPVVQLNEIFRQAQESSIIVNAHRINKGVMPDTRPRKDADDFYFVEEEEPERALQRIIQLVRERIPARFGLDPINQVQVLTPMNRGIVGTTNLNLALQAALNPNGAEVVRGGRTYRVGDKVMQIKNDYDREVFNGDIGRVTKIDEEEQELTVDIDGRPIIYDFSGLDELVLAYGVSIHKSQGSEYPAVVIPVLTQHYVMLQRNLLYTGVTRGKELVVLVGTKKALGIAVRNNKTVSRHTHLSARLN
ncbi:SF1B family DNA helicase RecD2 [Solidesulfovibrio magneticus]|uniref:Helicase RecD/TraA family protein n=1 Tax=Solidesulfovibrio magneticus (strain ATCC 700980 / DSM 13731 / RS-1) TaxID=573370 RepID=C4XQJ3_SOLM1|nr:ATP-dependent RecD-like DNA helicase [Solidesulfovibrio magneticus]BAH75358.1 helicase RecD/TraA family protein [Solidesulfovibrio magneticus RS-1]